MKTNQIMNLDCRKEENKEIIQKALRQIKPLSKYKNDFIPFSAIEKAILVMTKKYNMHIREFVLDTWSNSHNSIWRVVIINDNDLSVIDVIYGVTLYEVFAKSAIRMYTEVKKGISLRDKNVQIILKEVQN